MYLHIISREVARALGIKKYFTGVPCGRGHLSPRRTSNHQCVACTKTDEAKASAKALRDSKKNEKSEYNRKYYAENMESEKKRTSEYRKKNQDVYARWFEKNKELIRLKSRERRSNNPEAHKDYYLRNVDRFKAYYSEYNKVNRDRLAKTRATYAERNIEKARTWRRNTKLKRRQAIGRHSPGDVNKLLVAQKWKCAQCWKSVKSAYHVDHVVPLSKGGSNWPNNLQILCPPCNLSKAAKDPIEWAQENGRLL